MNDYYADLGVARDATPEEIKRAYRKLARRSTPTSTPARRPRSSSRSVSQAYDVLSDPDKKRRSYDLGADPYARGSGRVRPGLLVQRHHGRLLRGQGRRRQRGPRSRTTPRPGRPGAPRHRPRRRGVRRPEGPHHRHRRGLRHLPRRRDAAGHLDPHLRRLRRARRDPAGAAQLPRPGDDHPPLHDLPGLRPDHHQPLLRVLRRRPGAHPPHAHPQGARRCRHRHPHPARRRGRGRPRRPAPPATSTSRWPSTGTPSSSAAATTCTRRSRCR